MFIIMRKGKVLEFDENPTAPTGMEKMQIKLLKNTRFYYLLIFTLIAIMVHTFCGISFVVTGYKRYFLYALIPSSIAIPILMSYTMEYCVMSIKIKAFLRIWKFYCMGTVLLSLNLIISFHQGACIFILMVIGAALDICRAFFVESVKASYRKRLDTGTYHNILRFERFVQFEQNNITFKELNRRINDNTFMFALRGTPTPLDVGITFRRWSNSTERTIAYRASADLIKRYKIKTGPSFKLRKKWSRERTIAESIQFSSSNPHMISQYNQINNDPSQNSRFFIETQSHGKFRQKNRTGQQNDIPNPSNTATLRHNSFYGEMTEHKRAILQNNAYIPQYKQYKTGYKPYKPQYRQFDVKQTIPPKYFQVHDRIPAFDIIQDEEVLKKLYDKYPDNICVSIESLERIFHPYDARLIYSMVSYDMNKDITWNTFKWNIRQINLERAGLYRALEDLRDLSAKTTRLTYSVFIIIMLSTANFLVQVNVPLFRIPALILLFVFLMVLKDAFGPFVRILCSDPFISGDRVMIEEEPYFVDEINIFSSKFIKWDGQIVYISNKWLSEHPVQNIRKTGQQKLETHLYISADTPFDQIHKLRLFLDKLPVRYPKFFASIACDVSDIHNSDKLKLLIYIEHKTNFQLGLYRWNRHQFFMEELINYLQQNKIKYVPIGMPIKLNNKDINIAAFKDIMSSR